MGGESGWGVGEGGALEVYFSCLNGNVVGVFGGGREI